MQMAAQGVGTPISTVLSLYTADVGVVWVWLTVILPKNHTVTVDFLRQSQCQ